MDLYILEDDTHTLLRCQITKHTKERKRATNEKRPTYTARQSRYVSLEDK